MGTQEMRTFYINVTTALVLDLHIYCSVPIKITCVNDKNVDARPGVT